MCLKKSIQVVSIFAITALLGGCSMMDVQEVGNKTTTYYDQSGVKTHDVIEAVMIGDKYTEYGKLASDVADSAREIEASRVSGILTATATKEGDSESVTAWKSATATVAITLGATKIENAIKALYYGKDRYDNADTAIGAGAGVASAGVYTYGAAKILDAAFDAAGDSTTVNTDGDGNTATVEKSEINTETHANTTGDNASPSVTNDTGQGDSSTSSASGTTGTDTTISGLISDSQSSGLTTGETAVKLTEQGYSTTISGGEIYVDGTNYGGW